MKQSFYHKFQEIKISEAVGFSFKIWVSALLIFTILGAVSFYLYTPIRPANLNNLWGTKPMDEGVAGAFAGVWLRWDAIHYLRIAEGGYRSEELTAFFPLYPLLGRWVGAVVGSDLAGLLIVSRLSFLGALWLLYRLAETLFSADVAKFAVVFLAFFPTSVYLMAPYPLSLALLLSLAAVWFGLKKKWLLVLLTGLMAGLTHGTTVPLIIALGIMLFQQARKGPRLAWLNLFAAFGPALGTALFLAWRVHQGFPNMSALLFKYWYRIAQPPWMVINEFKRLFANPGDVDGMVNLAMFIGAVVLTIFFYKRLPVVMIAYQTAMLIFFSSTTVLDTPFGSIGRYLLLMFPLFIEIAILTKPPRIRLTTLAISFFSSLFLAMVYFMWGWLA